MPVLVLQELPDESATEALSDEQNEEPGLNGNVEEPSQSESNIITTQAVVVSFTIIISNNIHTILI